MWLQCTQKELSILVDHKLNIMQENEEIAAGLILQLPDGIQNKGAVRCTEICVSYPGTAKL